MVVRTLVEGIVKDPQRSFGLPILDAYGIRTEVICERFLAGETVDELSADYGIPSDEIQRAIRWQCRAPRRHRR